MRFLKHFFKKHFSDFRNHFMNFEKYFQKHVMKILFHNLFLNHFYPIAQKFSEKQPPNFIHTIFPYLSTPLPYPQVVTG